jgi:hypothetical protein
LGEKNWEKKNAVFNSQGGFPEVTILLASFLCWALVASLVRPGLVWNLVGDSWVWDSPGSGH